MRAFEQLRAVGTFTKNSATSRVKLTWNGHIRGTGVVATDWFCDFQLRVDGDPTDEIFVEEMPV